MQDGVSIINQSYLIQYINPAVEKELGPINCWKKLPGFSPFEKSTNQITERGVPK
jgi:hypothetical protein